jgi:hypothetical protein
VFVDEARCTCDDGYEGELCDACEAGLVFDGDTCVEPCDSSDAPDCGDNGFCEAEGLVAACACEHPFAGDACDECAQGFALQTNGTCEPDCGECGAHSFCNEELMTPSCECFAGYADDSGACKWVGDGVTGGVVDGELNDPTAWTTDYVTISGGVASFDTPTINGECKLGSLEQTLRMPERADAEQLVLEIQARTTCTSTDPESCPALLVDVGSSMTGVQMAGGPSPVTATLTTCLGDAAYGEDVLLRVRPALTTQRGFTALSCGTAWPDINRIGIRAATAGECPARRSLLGGLSGSAGWTLRGATVAGSKLTLPAQQSRAFTKLDVPSSGGVALKFTTSNPVSTSVLLDGYIFQIAQLESSASICLPAWTFGATHTIGFSMTLATFDVTNLRVETAPECATGAFDASFERPISSGSWSKLASFVTFGTSGGAAHGTRYWSLTSDMSSYVVGLLFFPGYGDDAIAPTLSASLRVAESTSAGTPEGTLSIAVPGTSPAPTLVTMSTGWASQHLCVPSHWRGQLGLVQVNGTARHVDGSGVVTLSVDELGPSTLPGADCD